MFLAVLFFRKTTKRNVVTVAISRTNCIYSIFLRNSSFNKLVFVHLRSCTGHLRIFDNDAVFFRTDPLFYNKFENMVIFRSGNLYTFCSPAPGPQEAKIIRKLLCYNCFMQIVEIDNGKIVFLLELVVIINES